MKEKISACLRSKEIRSRLLFTFLMMVFIRAVSQAHVPGVNPDFLKNYFGDSTDAYSFLNAFTGGGFENFSVFALSITPYITSSIIVQLLTIAFPSLEELARDGEEGRKKMNRITRYLTVGLSVFESAAMCIGFRNQGLFTAFTWQRAVLLVVSLTAGSCTLMWIGERIDERGVGNGISIVLLINIVSRIPHDLYTLWQNFVSGKTIAKGTLSIVVIAVIIATVTFLTMIVNGAERRIPIQYSQKMVGRRLYGGNGSTIPLKVNTGGVIPVIFASSIMSFPTIILTFLKKTPGGTAGKFLSILSSSNWFVPSDMFPTIGVALYAVLVIFFAYFYTEITFNPVEVADNLKKSGGTVPGVRPGKPTELYFRSILKYIIFIGAVGLIIVCLIPNVFSGIFNAATIGGTSLIIVASVILETMTSIGSMVSVGVHKSFLA